MKFSEIKTGSHFKAVGNTLFNSHAPGEIILKKISDDVATVIEPAFGTSSDRIGHSVAIHPDHEVTMHDAPTAANKAAADADPDYAEFRAFKKAKAAAEAEAEAAKAAAE